MYLASILLTKPMMATEFNWLSTVMTPVSQVKIWMPIHIGIQSEELQDGLYKIQYERDTSLDTLKKVRDLAAEIKPYLDAEPYYHRFTIVKYILAEIGKAEALPNHRLDPSVK